MMYLLFIAICFLFAIITVRFAKVISMLALILISAFFIGFLVMPLDLHLGGKIVGFSAGLFICGLLLHGLALLVSGVFLGPFALLWVAIKNLFR